MTSSDDAPDDAPDNANASVAEGPGFHYARIRRRLTELLATLDDEAWNQPTECCPGWRVRDVLGHLAGTVEDAMAGRLTGPPSDAQTAEQVDRHRTEDPRVVLAGWNASAPAFEDVITQFEIWPGAIDVLTHEHDIRQALGRPGARDDELMEIVAPMLVRRVDERVRLQVEAGGRTYENDAIAGPELTLRTTPFELLRVGLGRRSPDQVRALDWSADPGTVVDALFVFGPTTVPIIE